MGASNQLQPVHALSSAASPCQHPPECTVGARGTAHRCTACRRGTSPAHTIQQISNDHAPTWQLQLPGALRRSGSWLSRTATGAQQSWFPSPPHPGASTHLDEQIAQLRPAQALAHAVVVGQAPPHPGGRVHRLCVVRLVRQLGDAPRHRQPRRLLRQADRLPVQAAPAAAKRGAGGGPAPT